MKRIYLEYDYCLDGVWLRTTTVGDTQYAYRSDRRFSNLLTRCKAGGEYQKGSPTYVGCMNGFESFNEFVEWSISEYGYDLKDPGGRSWALDKDLLVENNKVYSPVTCMFIPPEINNFTTLRNNHRGKYPLGVSGNKDSSTVRAQLQVKSSTVYLGSFHCPFEAHRVWQKAKVSEGRRLAAEYKETHPKLFIGLNRWVDVIERDYLNNVQTTT